MKDFKFLILTLLFSTFFLSCVDDNNDELTGDAITGGLVNVNNPLISYVVGSGNTYVATGSVNQGDVKTTAVEIYNTFTNSVTGERSNRVLLLTIPISNTTAGEVAEFEVSFDYNQLIANLTVTGNPLPDNDSDLNIGDFWNLEYVSKTSTGNSNVNSSVTKVAVGTRYAGVYTVEDSEYWNSGSLIGGNWTGDDRIIESVNATVYRHVGLAFWDDNEFFFTVNNDTGYITVLPEDLEGNGVLLNGSPIMTCEGAGGNFEMIMCNATTSVATPDNVDGKDQLEFTVGYFRGVGSTREFYEKLVRKD